MSESTFSEQATAREESEANAADLAEQAQEATPEPQDAEVTESVGWQADEADAWEATSEVGYGDDERR
jgi:hypothetical protein